MTALSTTAIEEFLDTYLDGHLEELITFRRELHAHPELSGEEVETTARVAERLRVAGLDPRVLPTGTGLLCDLPPAAGIANDGRGPRVGLRADLDALAMTDETSVPYRSQIPGVAHACGHDVHTTVVLGAGLALTRLLGREGAPAGAVRLLFEPAEESAPGGAVDVIEAGGLTGLDWLFGLHCDPKVDVGRIGVRVGPITSAADLVTIRLHGPGGHTARPHLTVDLVALAGRLADQLPASLRGADPSLNLVFGALHAGDAANVIPATAVLRGTLRTPDRAAWDAAPGLLGAVPRRGRRAGRRDVRAAPRPRRPAGRERRAGHRTDRDRGRVGVRSGCGRPDRAERGRRRLRLVRRARPQLLRPPRRARPRLGRAAPRPAREHVRRRRARHRDRRPPPRPRHPRGPHHLTRLAFGAR